MLHDPRSPEGRRRFFDLRTVLRVAPAVVLAAENLAIFWNHYFRGWGFPWDFLGPYYAMVAYWTSGVRLGSFPQWVPYQSMGYPLAVNLQSGLSYPPFWIFPLFNAGYSLRRAVFLQCLHVLVGSLGAYALSRRCGRARRDALLAAIAFQLFGGFFSNAEHPDIVRGFALAPWLLWSLTLPPARTRRQRLPLWVPLTVFLLATGGYPGILLAGLLLGAVWVAVQVVERIAAGEPARRLLSFAASAAVLAGLGLAMAAIHLGPAWLHRSELARYSERAAFETIALGLPHLPGLFLPNRFLPGNVSMTSTFLPLPLLLAAFWAPWARRGVRSALVLSAVAAAMAAGQASPLYRLIGAIAPPLAYSRLPAADYRVFFALGLVLLGASGLARLRRAKVRLLRSWRLLAFAALFVWGLAATLSGRSERPAAVFAVASALAAILLFTLSRARRPHAAPALVASLAFLMLADAGRVLLRMQHLDGDLWRLPDVEGTCRQRFPDAFREGFDGTVPRELFETRSGPRGPRHAAPPGTYKAAGYLRGDLLVSDHSGTVLAARRAIEANQAWSEFMERPWTPLLLPLAADPASAPAFSSALEEGAARSWPPEARVVQTFWNNERIEYEVHLKTPALLVENEIFFPGWRATLSAGPGEPKTELETLPVAGAFRGWKIPSGSYRMTAAFDFPRRQTLHLLAAAAWLLWLVLLAAAASTRSGQRRRRPTG